MKSEEIGLKMERGGCVGAGRVADRFHGKPIHRRAMRFSILAFSFFIFHFSFSPATAQSKLTPIGPGPRAPAALDDSGSAGGPADAGAIPDADPALADTSSGGAAGGDLLSKYDKPSGPRQWFSKLKGLLGAGGSPARQGAQAYA